MAEAALRNFTSIWAPSLRRSRRDALVLELDGEVVERVEPISVC